MAEKINVDNLPEVAREKNLIVWLGLVSQLELDQENHQPIYQKKFGKEKSQGNLIFSIPKSENLDSKLKAEFEGIEKLAIQEVNRLRKKEGVTTVVRSSTEVNTYVNLSSFSAWAYEYGEAKISDQNFFFVVSIVFCALSLEAYLNHVGYQKIKFWDKLERLRPKEKLEILADSLGLTINFGARPFQSFQDIFKFRNTMVHAKSERLIEEGEYRLLESEFLSELDAEWEKFGNRENAKKFLADTDEMIKVIHQKVWPNDYPFMSKDFEYSARIKFD